MSVVFQWANLYFKDMFEKKKKTSCISYLLSIQLILKMGIEVCHLSCPVDHDGTQASIVAPTEQDHNLYRDGKETYYYRQC